MVVWRVWEKNSSGQHNGSCMQVWQAGFLSHCIGNMPYTQAYAGLTKRAGYILLGMGVNFIKLRDVILASA